MKRAALTLVLAACSSSSKDFPPLPEGAPPGGTSSGGNSGGTVGDAGVGDGAVGDGGVPISGQVCLVKDLRAPTSMCATTKADGFTVTLGAAAATDAGTATAVGTATTGPDGSFTMNAPLGAGFTWHVTGANKIVTSVMPFGTEKTIPAILIDDYNILLAAVGPLTVDPDHGSVVVRVVDSLGPVTGITAKLNPAADGDTFYDSRNVGNGSDPSAQWNNTSTQSTGVVWVPEARFPGPVVITLSRTDGTTVPTSAAVESQAITFVTQDLQ